MKVLAVLLTFIALLIFTFACNIPSENRTEVEEYGPDEVPPIYDDNRPDNDSSNTDTSSESDSADDEIDENIEAEDLPEIYEGKYDGSVSMNYALYLPKKDVKNMPLVVYLHGGSGKGTDLSILFKDGFPKYLKQGSMQVLDACVLIPQIDSDTKDWQEAADDLFALIKEIVSKNNLNAAKISLTGHSLGGVGTFALALSNPDFFSRIAPLSGSVQVTDSNVNKLLNLPIWAFVGSKDTIVKPESSIRMIERLQAKGSDATITVLEGATHFDVPEKVYLGDYDLLKWLTQ